MLWEVEVRGRDAEGDLEAARVLTEARALAADTINCVATARSFLIETEADEQHVQRTAQHLLTDAIVETSRVTALPASDDANGQDSRLINVLFNPGVTDNVARSTQQALQDVGLETQAVSTCRKYWFNADASSDDLNRVGTKVLANEAIEHVSHGPLKLTSISVGSQYEFEKVTVPLRDMSDDELSQLSITGQLYLDLTEMQTIRSHFVELQRDPSDIELETVAQTWSEHCSHKTLAGRIRYRDEQTERLFENMLKETIFAATVSIRNELGDDDWCVSVFEDNAGIVTFDGDDCVCFKVETHNHPSALEPYGGANTGLGGVIRDPLGTGLGAKPIFNTDVFCFAEPDTPYADLPPGVLHPKTVIRGVVSGIRDYGNRMGIPTVNGSVFFDQRYLGNPLVYCGNVALIPEDKCWKRMQPGDLVVAVGGRTGRDGIHGATFSSAELTHESETLSGGAVQIGNPIFEKMLTDVLLQARDAGLYSAITDCGAGGFSSAVGEMGEKTGAEVWLERCPLKYSGLSYTEIWISEAQERMVLAVPEENWQAFHDLCAAEGVEATVFGRFTDDERLVLKYDGEVVGDLSMEFLHDGRPPVVREATYSPLPPSSFTLPERDRYDDDLKHILSSLNVASKEWIIRQYDHEVQAGSVVKPLVGVSHDGPSDAAVVRPKLDGDRGLIVANGMNPHFGDLDPYWMAASAIDEAVRNCVAVGADPQRIAILDNFCWGNTSRPEILGSLVRAALACHDVAIAYKTPFISGKDSLNNEFSYIDQDGSDCNVTIPSSLLISAMGQMDDVHLAVTMDLKRSGNLLFLVGETHEELGGSHFGLANGITGGLVPALDLNQAPQIHAAVHSAMQQRLVRSCHDLSEGGLAVAIAEMAFAGELGVEIDLQSLQAACGFPTAVLLFSESNARFVCEVTPENEQEFLKCVNDIPVVRLGSVSDTGRVIIRNANAPAIDSSWSDLKQAWQSPLREV